jgi:hypothetical protein
MISGWHLNLAFWGGTALTVLICFLSGLRGLWLLIVTAASWFPISLSFTFLLNRVIPPPLEAYRPEDDLERKDSGSGLSLR